MANIPELRVRLGQLKNRLGLVGGGFKINENDEAEHNLLAHINPKGWEIEISVKKDWNPLTGRRQKAYARKRKITDGLEAVISHAFLHEVAHWELPFNSQRGCPYDVYNHDKILEAVNNALPADKKSQASYVANLFEDLMINPRCKEFNKGDFSGIVLFWDDQGQKAQKEGRKYYPAAYEAFVKLNLHLWGDNLDTALLKHYYSNAKPITNCIDGIVKDLSLPKNIVGLEEGTEQLFQRRNWPKMAADLARHIAPLLEQAPPNMKPSAYSSKNQQGSGSGQSQTQTQYDDKSEDQKKKDRQKQDKSPGQNGEDQKPKTPSQKQDKSPGKGKDKQPGQDEDKDGTRKIPAGNGVEEQMDSREGKEDVAYGRFGAGEQLSTNLTRYDQLDSLYRKLARSIRVNVEAITRESKLAIAPLTFRGFNPEQDDPSGIKASKVIVDYEGRATLGYRNRPLVVSARSKVQAKSFPDFKLVIIDNSGSMQEGMGGRGDTGRTATIPWGDNSKYHFALLGFYGIENFLQSQGISQYINHGVSLFSNSTRLKESGYRGISEVRKLALSPDFGGTMLDASVLKEALKGRQSFVLSISDGEIANWNEERSTFLDLAKNNYFAHIQIGGDSQFARDIAGMGLTVKYVNSGKDLSKLMVDLTHDTYRRFIHR